ncbi:MAG: hypothetical protein IBX72_14155 [Nitrospirae bacterium]|nr:hypothetical protein [Nitrospirota bacterium]
MRKEYFIKFSLGQTVVTRGVNSLITEDPDLAKFVYLSLNRHSQGDWGDLCEEDRKENEFSLKNGFRLLSSYKYGDVKICIITEADRSATTVLFPHEY